VISHKFGLFAGTFLVNERSRAKFYFFLTGNKILYVNKNYFNRFYVPFSIKIFKTANFSCLYLSEIHKIRYDHVYIQCSPNNSDADVKVFCCVTLNARNMTEIRKERKTCESPPVVVCEMQYQVLSSF
jgi:hypothetical protein